MDPTAPSTSSSSCECGSRSAEKEHGFLSDRWCPCCNWMFSPLELVEHVAEHHAFFVRFNCYCCGRRYFTKAAAQKHCRKIHDGWDFAQDMFREEAEQGWNWMEQYEIIERQIEIHNRKERTPPASPSPPPSPRSSSPLSSPFYPSSSPSSSSSLSNDFCQDPDQPCCSKSLFPSASAYPEPEEDHQYQGALYSPDYIMSSFNGRSSNSPAFFEGTVSSRQSFISSSAAVLKLEKSPNNWSGSSLDGLPISLATSVRQSPEEPEALQSFPDERPLSHVDEDLEKKYLDQEEYDTVAVDEEEREAWSLSPTPPPVPPHAPRQAEENWSLEDDKYFDSYPEEIALKAAEERGFWPDEARQPSPRSPPVRSEFLEELEVTIDTRAFEEIEEDPEHVQQEQLFVLHLAQELGYSSPVLLSTVSPYPEEESIVEPQPKIPLFKKKKLPENIRKAQPEDPDELRARKRKMESAAFLARKRRCQAEREPQQHYQQESQQPQSDQPQHQPESWYHPVFVLPPPPCPPSFFPTPEESSSD